MTTTTSPDGIYVDGAWVPSMGTARIAVVNPATEAVVGEVPEGVPADVDLAVAAARRAFDAWSRTDVAERADILQAASKSLGARIEDVAATITSEMGAPVRFSTMVQAGAPIANLALFAQLARDYEWETRVGSSTVVREAVGVVAAITPWNYPLHQAVAKVAAALAAGCTVVIKPSELSPLSITHLVDAFEEAGLPAGVLNVVHGTGPVVGEALAAHPDVDMVSFTGSTRAGRRVGALAADGIKRVALELGGKSASVVLDDADLAKAVKATVASVCENAGQKCSALSRLVVPRDRQDEVVELVAAAMAKQTPGDPREESTRLGPLVSDVQRERVREFIRGAVDDGARLVTGGADAPEGLERGYYVQPTAFADVDPSSRLAQEEVFGPVLAVLPYDSEDDAVRIANGTAYGLAGAVWSADEDRATRVARQLRTGQVDINGGAFNLLAPFGGYKSSGVGRELGTAGLEEYLELKSLQH